MTTHGLWVYHIQNTWGGGGGGGGHLVLIKKKRNKYGMGKVAWRERGEVCVALLYINKINSYKCIVTNVV